MVSRSGREDDGVVTPRNNSEGQCDGREKERSKLEARGDCRYGVAPAGCAQCSAGAAQDRPSRSPGSSLAASGRRRYRIRNQIRSYSGDNSSRGFDSACSADTADRKDSIGCFGLRVAFFVSAPSMGARHNAVDEVGAMGGTSDGGEAAVRIGGSSARRRKDLIELAMVGRRRKRGHTYIMAGPRRSNSPRTAVPTITGQTIHEQAQLSFSGHKQLQCRPASTPWRPNVSCTRSSRKSTYPRSSFTLTLLPLPRTRADTPPARSTGTASRQRTTSRPPLPRACAGCASSCPSNPKTARPRRQRLRGQLAIRGAPTTTPALPRPLPRQRRRRGCRGVRRRWWATEAWRRARRGGRGRRNDGWPDFGSTACLLGVFVATYLTMCLSTCVL